MVSNSPRALRPPRVAGKRPRLDAAQLGIVVVDMSSGGQNPPVTAWTALTFEVHAAAPLHAGIDGAAVALDSLPRFENRPAALRVRILVASSGCLAVRPTGGPRAIAAADPAG
jgi:hypothetical protein